MIVTIRSCLECHGTENDGIVVCAIDYEGSEEYFCKKCDINSIFRCDNCAMWVSCAYNGDKCYDCAIGNNCPGEVLADDVAVCEICEETWFETICEFICADCSCNEDTE